MASSRLYYKLKNECPVKRSGRAVVALMGMMDKALDEKRTHNDSDEKEKKELNEAREKIEGITVQASLKQEGKASRQEG